MLPHPLPPPRPQTPAEAGYPAPFLSPTEQTRRKQERQRFVQQKLAQVNALARVVPFSPALLMAMRSPFLDMRAKRTVAPAGPATPAGSDSFMPTSFWQTQYEDTPIGWKPKWVKLENGKMGWSTFNHWKNCCNTCKRMINQAKGYVPSTRVQLLKEYQHHLTSQPMQKSGLLELDYYIAHRVPVMIGVHFKFGTTYNEDHTTEHFIVLVSSGVENRKKYYRFFDVGTQIRSKGTDPRNRLYYDASIDSYSGRSYAAPKDRIYTISQIRFR